MQVFTVSLRQRLETFIATVLVRVDGGKKQSVTGEGPTAKIAYEDALSKVKST